MLCYMLKAAFATVKVGFCQTLSFFFFVYQLMNDTNICLASSFYKTFQKACKIFCILFARGLASKQCSQSSFY